MKLCALTALGLFAVVFASSQDKTTLDVKREATAIRKVLSDQSAAWNRGDIPGFMDGYVRSKQLRFASGGTFRHGWEATLKRYQASYPNSDAMGQLTFSDIRIKVLSKQWAEVFGRWHLKRTGDFEDISGLYTLLMQKTKDGWRVLHDHTSSKPADEE